MEPAWAALATELKRHGIQVAKTDGMQNRVLMKRFGVLGFPSIFLLRDGATWQYTGMRSVQDVSVLWWGSWWGACATAAGRLFCAGWRCV